MTNRNAVVVGGASGIGKAVAHALAADGCRVIVADRNADGARSVATELGEPHGSATVDVTDEDSVRTLFDDAGALDIVVNTAGFSSLGLIAELPVEDFRAVVDVCLTGSFLVIKHGAPRLRDGGALVSISSLNGRQPAAAMSAYCAAKGRAVDADSGRRARACAARHSGQRGRTRIRAHTADRAGHPHPGRRR